MKTAVASVFSVIRGVSVPLGLSTPGQPNIGRTLWRTVYDQKHKILLLRLGHQPDNLLGTVGGNGLQRRCPGEEVGACRRQDV